MNYKIGDKVLIREDSMYYTRRMENPRDVVGTICINEHNWSGMTYLVRWSNGCTNSYNDCDLRPYEVIIPRKQIKKHGL